MTQVRPPLATPAGQWHLRTPGSEAGRGRAGQAPKHQAGLSPLVEGPAASGENEPLRAVSPPRPGTPTDPGIPCRQQQRAPADHGVRAADRRGPGGLIEAGSCHSSPAVRRELDTLTSAQGNGRRTSASQNREVTLCIRAAVGQEHKFCGNSDLLPAGGQAPSKADRGALDLVVSPSLSPDPGPADWGPH